MIGPWILDPDDPPNADKAQYLGSELDGGFAEYTAVSSRNVHPVTRDLSDAEQLATFACAYTTADNLITRTGPGPAKTVAISGASNGVGSAAVQLCELRDAHIIAIASRSRPRQLIELDANAVIDRDRAG